MHPDPQLEPKHGPYQPRSVAAELDGQSSFGPPIVHVQHFTDPLSAWCWAAEPALLHLAEAIGGFISLEQRMTGLLESLRDEHEGEQQSFSRPSNLAMQWDEVGHLSGMPVFSDAWWEHPIVSSWPACAAVKAAQRQDEHKAALYLRRLREAALCLGEDIADPGVLEALAKETGLDAKALGAGLESGAAGEALQEDIVLCKEAGAISPPCLFFFGPAGVVEVRGARSFSDLAGAVEQAAGEPIPLSAVPSATEDRQGYVKALATSRGSLTAAEIVELLELDRSAAADLLDRMAAGGSLRRVKAGSGFLYLPLTRS